MRTFRETVARVAAAITVLAIMVLPPAGVVALIGSPFPHWERLRREAAAGSLTNDTTMRIAALIGLVLWVWAVIVITAETRDVMRARRNDRANTSSRPETRRPVRPPRVTARRGLLARLVRVALVGTVSTAATVSSFTAVALATPAAVQPHARPATTLQAAPSTEALAVLQVAARPAGYRTVIATGRETPLSLALDHGDETLRDQIIELNVGPGWTGGVFPTGMHVRIPVTTDQEDSVPDGALRYVVQPNDGLWSVAAALLGDGSRYPELRELVIGQQVAPGVVFSADTWVIHPGWVFTLPGSTDPPSTAADTAATHVVQRGESLSSIAARELGDASRWREVWDANHGHTMDDGATFNDPNLIQPGWTLQLPADQTAQLSPPAPVPSADIPSRARVPQPDDDTGNDVSTTTASSLPQSSLPTNGSADQDSPDRSTGSPIPAIDAVATPPPPSTNAGEVSDGGEFPPPTVTVVNSRTSLLPSQRWMIGGSSVVGVLGLAGIWVTLRRLQRRRHRWSLQRAVDGEVMLPVDPVAVAVAGGEAIGEQVAALRSISTADVPDHPLRAVMMNAAAIEVLFHDLVDTMPAGWVADRAANGWIRPLDGGRGAALALASPALVTIGIQSSVGECDVLLDLRTAGSLVVDGDGHSARSMMCALAWELAASPLGGEVDVYLVDFPCQSATTTARPARAVDVATAIAFAHHPVPDGDPMRVFCIDDHDDSQADTAQLDALVAACRSGSGNAVIVRSNRVSGNEQVTVTASGQSRWGELEMRAPLLAPSGDADLATALVSVSVSRRAQPEHAPTAPGVVGVIEPPPPVDLTISAGYDTDLDGPDLDGAWIDEPDSFDAPAVTAGGGEPRVLLQTCGPVRVIGAATPSALSVVFALAETGRSLHGSVLSEITGYSLKTLATIYTAANQLVERHDGTLSLASIAITDHALLRREAAALATTNDPAAVSAVLEMVASLSTAPYATVPTGRAKGARHWDWIDSHPSDVPCRVAAEQSVVLAVLDVVDAWHRLAPLHDRPRLVAEVCRVARLIPFTPVPAAGRSRATETSGTRLIVAAFGVADGDMPLVDHVRMAARMLVAQDLLEPTEALADALGL